MLLADLRFPNPKPLRREFIELIWKRREREGRGGGGGRERKEEGRNEAGYVGEDGISLG
jgi:hypothetical protein